MQMRKAINLIIILLVILIALLTAIIIINNRIGSGSGNSESNTEEPNISTDAPDSTKKPPLSTDDGSQSSSSTDSSTVSNVPDTSNSTVSGNAPDSFKLKKSIDSETGTGLNIRADVRGEADAATGKIKVTVLLYIDYRSLYIGERKNCRLSLGDTSEVFTVPAITEDDNSEHTQFIASVERFCDYGETLSLYAKVPFRGSYSDIEIDSLEIDTEIVVK